MRRTRKTYRVVVTFEDGRTREELVDALDYKQAETIVRRTARSAKSVVAFICLEVPA